jgi:hypothetical protein
MQTIRPAVDAQAVLHNPDMGWILYENYPVDQRPGGASTMLTLPEEPFEGVDAVAIMFAWSDIERPEGEYDFSKVDRAYDYWKARGKEIQLRMSTESLLWWNTLDPPGGVGIPQYVLDRIPSDQKQRRTLEKLPYWTVDARNSFYLERLDAFLQAAGAHFNENRPVTLIDLRGYGVWGEWHSGYQYGTVEDRREALKGVIDHWSRALPHHWLALSYSHDPSGPKAYYAGSFKEYEEAATGAYDDYVRYSAFDYALTRPNVTFRRDGAGGAIFSNQRKFCDEVFARRDRGPFVSEFCGGYAGTKKAGRAWQQWMLDDALSLHPNYVNLLGWQCSDALAFTRERPDEAARGLRAMGYRLVPVRITYPSSVADGKPFKITITWENRGVGRAMRDYALRLLLVDDEGKMIAACDAGTIPTSRWIKGETYKVEKRAEFDLEKPPNGPLTLRLFLHDPETGRNIALPLRGRAGDGSYPVGRITCR